MAAFNGKWQLVSSENFCTLLQACGISGEPLEKSKVFEVPGAAGVTEEFAFAGDKVTRKLYKPDGSLHNELTIPIGTETATKSIDGRDIKVKITLEGDSKSVRQETGPGYTATHTRTVNGDEMTAVIEGNGVKSVRKYKKC